MLSPIICVFAYKRPAHLEETLNSLESNQEASEIPVVIYVDAAKYPADLQAVANVLEVAHKPRRFQSIQVVARDANLGLYNSLTQGITEALKSHASAIVLEDDIRTSPFFLRYILEGLETYRDDKDVASIHAYTPPIATSLPETFFLRGADCWGWATWRDRWELYRHDASRMAQEIREKGLIYEFNLNGQYDYLGMLDSRAAGRNNSWAICWHASCFLANKLTLYPGKSLVQNIGLDGSGEHCGPSKRMDTEPYLKPIRVHSIPLRVSPSILQSYCNHFQVKASTKLALVTKIKSQIKKLRRAIDSRYKSSLCLRGPFLTYAEARLRASGYDSPVILEKVKNAIEAVLEGHGVYERDGTVFGEQPANLKLPQILECYLQRSSLVVDFGGGLGGTFINHATLFDGSQQCVVIEQENFVEAGRELARRKGLQIEFITSLEPIQRSPDIVILSSVLQYIPNVDEILKAVFALKPSLVIIDRTAFSEQSPRRWWLQIEDSYYGTPISYPLRPLKESMIVDVFQGYKVVERWLSAIDHQRPTHKGMVLERCS